MSRKLQLFFALIFFAFGFTSLQGQDLFAKANKQFQLGAYDLAIYNYQKLLKTDPENTAAVGNLAESYLNTQNYMEAVRWYDKLSANSTVEPRHMLNYAHVLKSLGLFDKAKVWYINYKDINHAIGNHYAQSCDDAKTFLQNDENYDIKLFTGNSPSSDFGVSFYNNRLIYCSFRTDMKREMGRRNFSHVQKVGNQLFVCSDKNNTEFTKVNFLRSEVKDIHNIGPLNYHGNKVVYSRNSFVDSYKQVNGSETDINIYFADVVSVEGDFENDIPFIHNQSGSSTAFPTYKNNGNTLIFSSNRTGGFGGFDLYISHLENGAWSLPINMGSEINTPGNEITPHVNANKMYFSSDYHSGIGGYDIFKCNISFDNSVSGIENLGKGVNSPMDDYYYVIDPINGLSYFSSTRLGGKGKEDIYIAKELAPEMISFNDNRAIPQAVNLEKLVRNTPEATNAIGMSTVSALETMVKMEEDVATPGVILSSENVIVNVTDAEVDEVIAEVVADSDKSGMETSSNATSPVVMGTNNYFSLDKAKKIAHNKIITAASSVYFIQLASLSRTRGDIKPFLKLSELGNLYKVRKNGTVKIRMGYFFDEYESSEKLREIKNRGFKDAFVVYEPLITSELELVNVGTSKTYYEGDYIPKGTVSNYKIRLASYTDPLWFDTGSVKDVGEIEQWTKGEFTIFILSGYSTYEEADSALIKVINRGYSEAHMVEDVNGYLQKVQRN